MASPANALLIGEPTNTNGFNELSPKATNVVAINAGGPQFTDSKGVTWQADKDFLAGTGGTNSTTHAISGTDDPQLFQTQRWGATGYDIPVPNGNYSLQLLFAETNPTSGTRVFDVAANDVTLLSDYSIHDVAGDFSADLQTFPLTVSGGMLHLRFHASQNASTIGGIELSAVNQPACPSGESLLRVNAGGPQVTDSQGRTWVQDVFSQGGGGSGTTTTPISNT